jgi:hypothetical protein
MRKIENNEEKQEIRNAPDVKRYYENMFELSESELSTPVVAREKFLE